MSNIYALQRRGDWEHGHVVGDVGFKATASIHRGIDFSAQLEGDIEAKFSTELARAVEATFGIGADVQAGLALQAACPVDLFTGQAGLVARLEAEAEAAAWVTVQLALELDALRDLIVKELPDSWIPVVDAFLAEVEIRAGLFGKASASAEIIAQAVLAGSFVADSDADFPAGFTFSAQASAGLALGAGFEVRANVGFRDPSRLMDRLAGALVEGVLAQVTDAPEAVPYVRVLLPLIVRSAMEIGFKLASGSTVESAAASAGRQFVQGAQAELLHLFFSLVADHTRGVLHSAVARIEGLTTDEVREIAEAFTMASAAIARATAEPRFDITAWCDIGLDVIDVLADVAETPLVEDQERPEWIRYLALGWAAVTLLRRAFQASGPGNPFDETAVPAPNSPSILAEVMRRLGKPSGTTLTASDTVTFVLSEDWTATLRYAFPEISSFLDWLNTVFGQADKPVVVRLLSDLAALAEADAAALLPLAEQAITTAVEDQIVPWILDPASARSAEWRAINDGVIKPLLNSFGSVLMPGLESIRAGGEIQPVREQLSGVLLQLIADVLIETLRQLAHVGLGDGSDKLREIADSVRAGDGGEVVGALDAAMGASPFAILVPDEYDIAALIDAAADAMSQGDQLIGPGLSLAQAILALSLQDGFNVVDMLRDPEAIPELDRLKELTGECCDAGLSLASTLASDLSRLIDGHFERLGEQILKALEDGAKAIIAAVKSALQAVRDLEHDLDILVAEAVSIVANLLQAISDLASWARGLVDTAVERIRLRTWNTARVMLYDVLPRDVAADVEDKVHAVLNEVFDAARWMLDAPLDLLQHVAEWVHDDVMAQVAAGAVSNDLVRTGVRQRAAANPTQDFSVRVSLFGIVDLGIIRVPGGDVLGVVTDVLFSNQELDDHIATAADHARSLVRNQAQQGALSAVLADTRNKDKALIAAGNVVGVGSLMVTIDQLEPEASYVGQATASITIRGANSSYLDAVLGMPPRVRVVLNGEDIAYKPDAWARPNRPLDALELTLVIVPNKVGLVPSPPRPGHLVSLMSTMGRPFALGGQPVGLGVRLSDPGATLNFRSYVRALARHHDLIADLPLSGNGNGPDEPDGPDGPQGPAVPPILLDFPDVDETAAPVVVLGRRGLNILQVLATDGADDGRRATASLSFYLAQLTGLI